MQAKLCPACRELFCGIESTALERTHALETAALQQLHQEQWQRLRAAHEQQWQCLRTAQRSSEKSPHARAL
jgi:hypothetical protein